MQRLSIVSGILATILLLHSCNGTDSEESVLSATRPPNFIVIFCDDVGYGDLGAYGHPTIRTPSLDRMAAEGQKWTSFYVGASVCTPSRAALLTGRLPIRSGMCSSRRRVLFPDSGGGIPEDEVTLAEALKEQGYATACVGKWHLGHLPQFLPTEHGFDYYYGIPYSNDMDRVPESPSGLAAFDSPRIEYWNVPLLRNEAVVERPADQTTITRRYTEEAIRFIEENQHRPFFVYLAHSMAHVPLFVSPEFEGRSLRGLYGDVIEEIDWSVGQVLSTLEKCGLARDTLVVFTSDNGPWLTYGEQGGSAGLLRGGKGGTFEGGMREPAIFWWPETIKPGVIQEMGTAMDIFPTFVALAGGEIPRDRVYDGFDLTPIFSGSGTSGRNSVFYYRGSKIYAVRLGEFKAHFVTRGEYDGNPPVPHDPPLLFNLEVDPSERFDIASDHPDVIEAIRTVVEQHRSEVETVTDQLAIPLSSEIGAAVKK